jgi:hypothetical protein
LDIVYRFGLFMTIDSIPHPYLLDLLEFKRLWFN